jgi:hypothetical protein
LWNGKDPILKERIYGLTNSEANHGEDVKEYYFYLDSTPTHSYMKYLYKRLIALRPADQLVVAGGALRCQEQTSNICCREAVVTDFPRSLIAFQQRFSDEAACVSYVFAARWPDGFVCPACGTGKAWELQTKAWTWECAGCGKQTSVTAGTIMHHSKLPLTIWFWAADLMATRSNSLPRRGPGASRRCNCNASRLRQDGLADLRRTAPQHGGARSQPARRPGRGRRDRNRRPRHA